MSESECRKRIEAEEEAARERLAKEHCLHLAQQLAPEATVLLLFQDALPPTTKPLRKQRHVAHPKAVDYDAYTPGSTHQELLFGTGYIGSQRLRLAEAVPEPDPLASIDLSSIPSFLPEHPSHHPEPPPAAATATPTEPGQQQQQPNNKDLSRPGVRDASRRRLYRIEPPKRVDLSPQRSPSPPAPVGGGDGGSPSPRRVYGASDRLLRALKRRALPPIERGPALTRHKEEELTERLYARGMQRQQQVAERAARELQQRDRPAARRLDPDQEEQLVQKLYYHQQQLDQQHSLQLERKYLVGPQPQGAGAGASPSPGDNGNGTQQQQHKSSAPPKLRSKEEEEESVQRLYFQRKNLHEEVHRRLVQKYIVQRERQWPRRPEGEIQQTVARLYARGTT